MKVHPSDGDSGVEDLVPAADAPAADAPAAVDASRSSRKKKLEPVRLALVLEVDGEWTPARTSAVVKRAGEIESGKWSSPRPGGGGVLFSSASQDDGALEARESSEDIEHLAPWRKGIFAPIAEGNALEVVVVITILLNTVLLAVQVRDGPLRRAESLRQPAAPWVRVGARARCRRPLRASRGTKCARSLLWRLPPISPPPNSL